MGNAQSSWLRIDLVTLALAVTAVSLAAVAVVQHRTIERLEASNEQMQECLTRVQVDGNARAFSDRIARHPELLGIATRAE